LNTYLKDIDGKRILVGHEIEWIDVTTRAPWQKGRLAWSSELMRWVSLHDRMLVISVTNDKLVVLRKDELLKFSNNDIFSISNSLNTSAYVQICKDMCHWSKVYVSS